MPDPTTWMIHEPLTWILIAGMIFALYGAATGLWNKKP